MFVYLHNLLHTITFYGLNNHFARCDSDIEMHQFKVKTKYNYTNNFHTKYYYSGILSKTRYLILLMLCFLFYRELTATNPNVQFTKTVVKYSSKDLKDFLQTGCISAAISQRRQNGSKFQQVMPSFTQRKKNIGSLWEDAVSEVVPLFISVSVRICADVLKRNEFMEVYRQL